MPRNNILLAMFDVKPTKESGDLDFEKISQVRTKINLRKEPAVPQSAGPTLIERQAAEPQAPVAQKADQPLPDQKTFILRELEEVFVKPVNAIAELTRAGAQIHPFVRQRPGSRLGTISLPKIAQVASIKKVVEYKNVRMAPVFTPSNCRPAVPASLDLTGATPISREVDFWLAHLDSVSAGPRATWWGAGHRSAKKIVKHIPRIQWRPSAFLGKKFLIFFVGIISVGALAWWTAQSGIWARNNIIQNGSNAVANLEYAKQKLEDLKFQDAANSFALAYDDLNKASGTLNELGASFLSVFGSLPGLGKIKAANNLVEAGRSISKAGENLASALGTLYDSNPLSFLNPSANPGSKSFSKLLGGFRAVLVDADKNIKKAGSLLADIDASVIPADKQAVLLDFKERIPQFQEYIGNAINYSDFLLKLIGSNGEKTYLILLQNNSELRPTGGFPGTYALITFEDGSLAKIFVDDIYQIDANLKENIVPPLQMQHITPTWGMRDANWFTDFPTSARKVEEFYQKDGGGKVDGVLAITPDIIADMLKIIGPIDMPEYDMILGADNFLAEIQNEVEYEADRSKPKKILTDLQPKFFEKLSGQDKDGWIEIFRIITKAAEEKHILAYFNDPDLEKTAVENGLGGEMKQKAGDYLQIVFANVKGSKTDFVTDSSFNLETSLGNDGGAEHTLTISRMHSGGDSQYGFYNRENSAYIKVFVPQGSVLESVIGQSITDFQPLIDYEGFKRDPDLERIEGSVSHPVGGVDISEESGKTVFGFWLIVKPKQTKSVVLKYHTPTAGATGEGYALYWQKQSGTGDDHINFSFKLPNGASVVNKSPGLQLLGDNLVLNSDLSVDREIEINF